MVKEKYCINTINSIRYKILDMIFRAKCSHIGSAFSIVEVLYVLYFHILNIDPTEPAKEGRDKFILSKAHAASALYAVLALKGFFSNTLLDGYMQENGAIPAHIDKDAAPGLEVSGGSLGHGLSLGLGMAIASKLKNEDSNVYVLLSDGEMNEGSVWESIMYAGANKIKNLTVIIDYNQIQSFGITKEIINLENLGEKLKVFGWNIIEVNGHDVAALELAFREENLFAPKAIIANTVKGCGVSFMENKLEWHYKSPNKEEFEFAAEEIKSLTLEKLKEKFPCVKPL